MLANSGKTCALLALLSPYCINGFTAPFSGVRKVSSLSMSSALVVQNKGGGHGELGYQICKQLSDSPKITSITILQDEACNPSKEPFKSYSTDLPNVRVVNAPLGDNTLSAATIQGLLGEEKSYDYVWDNASKKPEGGGKAICDLAKTWGTKLFTYVSSAGMYQPGEDAVFPMPESTPIKSSAGQALFDEYAVKIGLPFVSFRPQYIYGEKANKFAYIDWYFDRLVRGLPLPIPYEGTQKVSLTNSQDVASLLVSVLDSPESATKQRFFNCGTDQLFSYDEVAFMCASVMGCEDVKIVHYDADQLGKGAFPFRLTNFYVAPDTAKKELGWSGAKNGLAEDLKWYYENYMERGGPNNPISLEKDWEIVKGSDGADASLYTKWDPQISA